MYRNSFVTGVTLFTILHEKTNAEADFPTDSASSMVFQVPFGRRPLWPGRRTIMATHSQPTSMASMGMNSQAAMPPPSLVRSDPSVNYIIPVMIIISFRI